VSETTIEEPGRAPVTPGREPRNLALRAPPGGASRLVAGGPAVQVIEDERALDALEAEWNALLERSDATVFQSFEWQRAWWRHFGEGRRGARLHVLAIRAAGALVGIAPFYVQRVRLLGAVPLRRLLFIGCPDSDYLDVLAARGREAECAERIAAHLAARPGLFDVAVLEELPDRSATAPLLRDAFAGRGWAVSRHLSELCPRTALRATWEETVAGFPINYRRETRRRLRNIEKAYEVRFERIRPGDPVVPAMREFIDMHQERWVRDGYWGAFADPRLAAFQCDVAERLSGRGWLFLAFLRADGVRCAANYGFAFRSEVSTYLGGARDEGELRRYSPGRVLHAKSMQWAIEQGARHYDFMRGREHYKYELDATDVPNWTVVAYPRRPRLAGAVHRLEALASKAARRARREAHALRTAARDGWLSAATRRHVRRRLRRLLEDVARVARGRTPPAAAPGGDDGSASPRAEGTR
jgi:CelD/BcsL family acetyltransferase involved in cellulose biosynthesis